MRASRNFIVYLMPLVIVIVALSYLRYSEVNLKRKVILMGRPLPMFYMPSLMHPGHYLYRQELLGKVSIINVWASWCAACHREQSILMRIKTDSVIPIYGINFKDNPDNAKKWLAFTGNPYDDIGIDLNGAFALQAGIYGIPATFLIDSYGMIRYQHLGILTETIWQQEFLPRIKEYTSELAVEEGMIK